MTVQRILMRQSFNAPVDQVFSILSDHEKFGEIIGVNIKRIKAGDDGANGLGSVRKLNIGILPSFEETITQFAPNQLIEYKITKGSPIKNHVGTLRFEERNGQTTLEYTIDLESKIPGTTGVIKTALSNGITKGLKKLAAGF